MILPKIIMQAIIEAHTISTPGEVINEKLNNVRFVSRARKIKPVLLCPALSMSPVSMLNGHQVAWTHRSMFFFVVLLA